MHDPFYQENFSLQDKYVAMSGKREESLAEASETLRMEQRNLNSCSLEYVKYYYVFTQNSFRIKAT